ncbi:MAG TPA: hypothetical protein VK816_10170 [Jatrophihabitantaceae bacterium]|jgi:hypothetical protein|nr:hypothetical protein [Jatrophihabitantaceae bacterium]
MTDTTNAMNSSLRRWEMPRRRGSLTGFGLVLLGAWGAVIPFVGPYFNYAYTPNTTWTWTAARCYLQVVPGAVTFLAGVVILASTHRVGASVAGWLAAASGAWFVVGPLLAPLWRSDYIGTPTGNKTDISVEQIGMFYGLGAAILLLAGLSLGRFSLVGLRDPAYRDRLSTKATMRRDASMGAVAPGPSTWPAEAPADSATTGERRHGWIHRGHRPVAH